MTATLDGGRKFVSCGPEDIGAGDVIRFKRVKDNEGEEQEMQVGGVQVTYSPQTMWGRAVTPGCFRYNRRRMMIHGFLPLKGHNGWLCPHGYIFWKKVA